MIPDGILRAGGAMHGLSGLQNISWSGSRYGDGTPGGVLLDTNHPPRTPLAQTA